METKVDLAPVETNEPKQLTEEEIRAQERNRILTMILRSSHSMTSDYKKLVSYTGGVLTASMTLAYTRAINDVIKLLTKRGNNEEPVQK